MIIRMRFGGNMLELKKAKPISNIMPMMIKTIFGKLEIEEPVVIELMHSKAMQRLKGIHQYGVSYYSQKKHQISRFDHSVAVMHLLYQVNASLHERIAGLLHDVSHTVFSHVGDVIFDQSEQSLNSYQDDIHAWFLEQTDIPEILQRYGISIEEILHKNEQFKALEQPLPAICADRLAYLTHDGYYGQVIEQYQIPFILNSVRFEQGNWYFTDIKAAQLIAYASTYLNEHHFGAAWNIAIYHWAARAIKHAFKKGIVTKDEIHFSQDDNIWRKLHTHGDEYIHQMLEKIKNCPEDYHISKDVHDMHVLPKFRGVNPLVMHKGKLHALTELDSKYAQEYERVQRVMQEGRYLKLD